MLDCNHSVILVSRIRILIEFFFEIKFLALALGVGGRKGKMSGDSKVLLPLFQSVINYTCVISAEDQDLGRPIRFNYTSPLQVHPKYV